MSGNTNKELNTLKLSVNNRSTSRTAVAKNNSNAVKLKTVAAKSASHTGGATLTTPKCRPTSSNQKAIVQTENKRGSISKWKKPAVSIKRAQSTQSIASSASNRSHKIESNPAGRLAKRCSSLQAVCDKTVHKEHIPQESTQNKNGLNSMQLLNENCTLKEEISVLRSELTAAKFESKNCFERKSKVSEVHIENKGAGSVNSCLQLQDCLKTDAEESTTRCCGNGKLEAISKPQEESKTSEIGSRPNSSSWQPCFPGGHEQSIDVGREGNFCHRDKQTFHDLVQRIQTLKMNKMELEEELGKKCGEITELQTVTSQIVEERKNTSCRIEHLVSNLELARMKCVELEVELKESVRQFQLEKQEWKQFQKDLQTAVVVADRFRFEAQEELSKVMAQNRELKDFVTSLKRELHQAKREIVQQNFDPTNYKNKLHVFLTPDKNSTISRYLMSDVKAVDLKVQQSSVVTAATRTKLPSEEEKAFCICTSLSNMTTNMVKSDVQSPGHCCKKLSLFQHSSSPVNQKHDTSLESSPKQQGTSTFRWPTGCSASPARHLVSQAVVSDDVKQAAVESVFIRANKENLADNKRLPLADILTNKVAGPCKKKCLTTNVLRSVNFNL